MFSILNAMSFTVPTDRFSVEQTDVIVTVKAVLVGTPAGRGTRLGNTIELVQEAAKLKTWSPSSE